MPAPTHSRILILDFGSQVTQLIARRLREAHVYCEIHPWDVGDAFVREFAPRGIVLSGSHESVYDAGAGRAPEAVWKLGVPVLGICYGMQTMALQLGGSVEPGNVREFGYAEVRARGHSALLRDIEDRVNAEGHGLLDVWMSHGDHVVALPRGFKAIASTADVPNAGMADESRRFYALQFHPEVTHTRQGARIYERFLREICGCDASWNAGNIIEDAVARVRAQVGGGKVLLGLSGGVDSSVVAALLHKAIGDQLTCVFVDHGLLRHHEGDQVMATFAENLGVKVIRVDAEARFLDRLTGVTDPEQKRKIIGNLFVAIFEEESQQIPHANWLAQGTIYPDVIESAGARTYPLGALTVQLQGEVLAEIQTLAETGCVAFMQTRSLPHDNSVMLQAMRYARTFDLPLWLRPVEDTLAGSGVAAAGPVAGRLGLPSIPVVAETVALHTIFELQRASGARVHICRLSSAAGVELVCIAVADGQGCPCFVKSDALDRGQGRLAQGGHPLGQPMAMGHAVGIRKKNNVGCRGGDADVARRGNAGMGIGADEKNACAPPPHPLRRVVA